MIDIRTNSDNSEYLVISRCGVGTLFIEDKVPQEIKKIAKKAYYGIIKFEKEKYISEVSIKKDSELGNYLLHTEDIKVYNDDIYVTYEKVVNSFNIAIFESNPISEKILPLFKKQISGTRNKLLENYDVETIDYILSNPNFCTYLDKINGEYEADSEQNECVVYENDKCSIQNFNDEKSSKMKTKKHDNQK